MTHAIIPSAIAVFTSRLSTLEHLLQAGTTHTSSAGDAFLASRLVSDMLPLGTQVAFTCNQPRNFCRWLRGEPASNLDPDVPTLALALRHIDDTKALLWQAAGSDVLLDAPVHLELGNGSFADLSGHDYLHDFLMPNFYFHLVTAYGILRMAGVPIGKRDFMQHLLPKVQQHAAGASH